MEVLATLSSLISLLEVSITVIKTGLRYYSDFKSADRTLRYFSKCLVEELDSLKRLKALCDVLRHETSPHSVECLKQLDKIFQDGLDGPHSFYTGLSETIEWLKKMENKRRPRLVAGVVRRRDLDEARGMSCTDKLTWVCKKRKEVESLISQLDYHRRRVDHTLLVLQRSALCVKNECLILMPIVNKSYIAMDVIKELQKLPTWEDLRTTQTILLSAMAYRHTDASLPAIRSRLLGHLRRDRNRRSITGSRDEGDVCDASRNDTIVLPSRHLHMTANHT